MKADVPKGWPRSQRRLHWWTATLVCCGFALGWLMISVPDTQLLLKFLLFQLHKTIGLLVLLLVVVRLVVRTRYGRPPWEDDLPAWQQRAARVMHWLLYALLLTTPVLGYLTASTAPAQVPTLFLGVIPVPDLLATNPALFAVLRLVHRGCAIALLVLAAGHVAAAIHNHLLGRATLVRMWSGAPARTAGPITARRR